MVAGDEPSGQRVVAGLQPQLQGALGAADGIGANLAAAAGLERLLQMPLGRLGIVGQERIQRGAGLLRRATVP